jgi:hypothetical protein
MAPALGYAPYEALRAKTVAMVGAGYGFAEIEDEIRASEVTKEYGAALWLLAWSLQELAVKSRPPYMVEGRPPAERQLPRPVQDGPFR